MDYKIKEETLSGIANAIRSKTGGTEAISAANFAEIIETFEAEGSSDIILFEKQTVNGFRPNANFGNLYFSYIAPAPLRFVLGEKYFVEWDDTEYEVTAQDTGAIIAGTVAVGNGSIAGLQGNNEPFIIISAETDINFFALDTKTSHSIKIYQKTSAVVTVETSVDLDFSNGDMEVAPNEGKAFSKVNIQKPGNLVPENIVKGIDIAGVIGTGGAKFASGTFNGSATKSIQTITHNLGVIPDIIFIQPVSASSEGNKWMTMIQYSEAFKTTYNLYYSVEWWGMNSKSSGSNKCYHSTSVYIEDNNTTHIHGATTEIFKIPANMLDTYPTYAWIAIGNLA